MTLDDTETLMKVEEHEIDGPHGRLQVRTYRPRGPLTAGLVWVHGGAFVSGDLEMPESDWVGRGLADGGVFVVTVDYRLAPMPPEWAAHGLKSHDTSRFPIASEEITQAYRWATGIGAGVAPHSWALGGASAGANLAASATLRLIDRADGPPPAAVVLAYPLVHAQLPEMSPELRAKYEALPPPGGFSPESVLQLNLNYVGDVSLLQHRYAFPGGQDLTGFPPTLILNSDLDSLRASGELFAAELIAAGCDVTVVREPGTVHGHLNEPDTTGARRSLARAVTWLRHALAPLPQ